MADSLDVNDLLLFVRVAECGSFSRAAERLNLPKSTVSRRIAALERRLGERLLQRTTRQLRITEWGEAVLGHACELAAGVDEVLALASNRRQQPGGRLRVTMPGDLANQVLASAIARFVDDFPAVALELDLSPRRVDLVAEGFDLAIRIGALADDASLVARRIAQFRLGLFAAPQYLARFAPIEQPEQLRAMHGLALAAREGDERPWLLTRDADGQRWQGRPARLTQANSPDLLVALAAQGAGVTGAADFYVEAQVRSGALVRVLPAWCLPPETAWGVYPGRRLVPSRTRVFLEAMADALKPCREQG